MKIGAHGGVREEVVEVGIGLLEDEVVGEKDVLDEVDGVRAEEDNNDVAMGCGWKHFGWHRLPLSHNRVT